MTRTLVKGGLVVSMDDGFPEPFGGDVLIEGETIQKIGHDISAENAHVIDASDMIVMPGFVNSHLHTWQAALRGVAGDWTFRQYMRAVHAGLATAFRPRDIFLGNLFGALNQLNSGTTTLVDWCHNNPTPEHSDAAIDGLSASGIRAVFLHGSAKPNPKPGQKHYSEVPMSRDEVRRLRVGQLSSDDARITMGLAILGPRDSIYDVTCADLRLAREYGLLASAHTGGAPFMVPDALAKLISEGLIDNRVNFVHANNLQDEDLKRFVGAGGTVTVTADVEMLMAFGDPLTGKLRDLGACMSVGTDVEPAVASDMFGAMRTPLQVQRNLDNMAIAARGEPVPEISTIACRDALAWATINGAKMLGMEDRIGSLGVGKQADLILLRASDLNMFPVWDPYTTIVMQANPQNVDTVIVAGEMKKSGGAMVGCNVQNEMLELQASGARILRECGLDEKAKTNWPARLH